MTITNELVQEHFDNESSKMFNKQILILREFHQMSEEDKVLFDDFVKFCQGCDSAQLKALRVNSKQKEKIVPQTIDSIVDLMGFVLDLRKKPQTIRYKEVFEKGTSEKMEQECLLALAFCVGVFEIVGSEKRNDPSIFKKLKTKNVTMIESISQLISEDDIKGFDKLEEYGQLKYSFEQFVLRQEFSRYFSNETCEKAVEKLNAVGY